MGSVVNTPTQSDSAALPGTATTRPNPVALETLVNVTGARPSSEGTRDLFTEETRTILVFVDGAVIQLESPVSEGQLLFLTNKKSNEEIVCQVLQKKKIGTTSSYVELQFTEEKPNYWGVAFPKGKKRAAEFTAAEQVAAEQVTERETGAAPPVRDERAVEELKNQVETLRKQLAELEKQNAAERVAAEQRAATEAARKTAKESSGTAAKIAPESDVSPKATSQKDGGEALLMPPAAGEKKTPGWTVKMALPTQATEPGQSGDAESLPKPELDFSRVPQTDSLDEIALRASMKGSSPFREKIRVAGFIVVLAAVGFGAYEKLAPFVSSMMKKTATAHIAEKVTSPKAAVTAKPANASAPSPVVAPAATPAITPTASPAPASSNATTGSAAPSDQKDTAEANSAVTPASNEKTPAAEAPKLRGEGKKPAGKERSAKKSVERESPAEAAPSDSVPADAPVIPAKLIRSAPPVYPPNAMRGYITGDVKAELLVEANGSVGEVKVLSGPSALREAAVEALKKYEYAPATQGGKAVASKTTAVVKFWFNP